MKNRLRMVIKIFGAAFSGIGLLASIMSLVGTFLPVYIVDGFWVSIYGIAFSAWDCGEMICSFHWVLWLPLVLYFLSLGMGVKGFTHSFQNHFYEGGIYYFVSAVGYFISAFFFGFSRQIAQTSYAYAFGYYLTLIFTILSCLISGFLAISILVFPTPLKDKPKGKQEDIDYMVLEEKQVWQRKK